MPTLLLQTKINADINKVFDLARSVEAHVESTPTTHEQAVGGKTSGLLVLGDLVTWRAKHFGVWQELTVKMTEFQRPDFFADEMLKGAFRSMRHVHRFSQEGSVTTMTDEFEFQAPFGFLGRVAEILFLTSYMRRFLKERAMALRAAAEANPEA